jgi:hypothetical protein
MAYSFFFFFLLFYCGRDTCKHYVMAFGAYTKAKIHGFLKASGHVFVMLFCFGSWLLLSTGTGAIEMVAGSGCCFLYYHFCFLHFSVCGAGMESVLQITCEVWS